MLSSPIKSTTYSKSDGHLGEVQSRYTFKFSDGEFPERFSWNLITLSFSFWEKTFLGNKLNGENVMKHTFFCLSWYMFKDGCTTIVFLADINMFYVRLKLLWPQLYLRVNFSYNSILCTKNCQSPPQRTEEIYFEFQTRNFILAAAHTHVRKQLRATCTVVVSAATYLTFSYILSLTHWQRYFTVTKNKHAIIFRWDASCNENWNGDSGQTWSSLKNYVKTWYHVAQVELRKWHIWFCSSRKNVMNWEMTCVRLQQVCSVFTANGR